jgi:3-hydroxyacyl-CoA dehydrogenase/enoyl-CoA hydratase/3-hydroxybutyryl-CoA epimerase/enoyl-CoA isomerase
MSFFQFEELDGGIGLLTFDCPGAKVNTLGQPIQEELEQQLTMLEGRTDLQGLLLKSGKPGQFIAGADLKELAALAKMTPDEAKGLMERGHAMFNRVSRLPYPTVALIDGACMGGGTEFVLAMDDRLVSDNRKTKIALPETGIGIIPGWGGTQRMPRVIGLNYAIDMICGGKPISSDTAVKYGFAFDMVPIDDLLDEGKRRIADLNESGDWKIHREMMNQPLGLSADEMQFAFACAEGNVRGKTKGQYPAPLVALRAIQEGVNRPLADGLQREIELSQEVVGSLISANLIAVFFMNNMLARDPGVDNKAIKPRDINRIGVLGAGQMGAGIATAHARSGIPAVIVDIDDERVAAGMSSAQKVVTGRMKIGRATA